MTNNTNITPQLMIIEIPVYNYINIPIPDKANLELTFEKIRSNPQNRIKLYNFYSSSQNIVETEELKQCLEVMHKNTIKLYNQVKKKDNGKEDSDKEDSDKEGKEDIAEKIQVNYDKLQVLGSVNKSLLSKINGYYDTSIIPALNVLDKNIISKAQPKKTASEKTATNWSTQDVLNKLGKNITKLTELLISIHVKGTPGPLDTVLKKLHEKSPFLSDRVVINVARGIQKINFIETGIYYGKTREEWIAEQKKKEKEKEEKKEKREIKKKLRPKEKEKEKKEKKKRESKKKLRPSESKI
jgi:hypothetical protein